MLVSVLRRGNKPAEDAFHRPLGEVRMRGRRLTHFGAILIAVFVCAILAFTAWAFIEWLLLQGTNVPVGKNP
jgi:hypothetical protein